MSGYPTGSILVVSSIVKCVGGGGVSPKKIFGLNNVKLCKFRQDKHEKSLL